MDCHRPHLKPWLCALLLAGAWPAVAQDAVIFSKPANLPTDKANDFMGGGHNLPGALNPSSSKVGSRPQADFDALPGAPKPRPLTVDQLKALQKSTDERKNWTLLTPERIMGVPTSWQIMGVPDPNHEENLSVTEQYLNRQERLQNTLATNAMHQEDYSSSTDQNPFRSQRSDQRKSDSRNSDQRKFQTDGRRGISPQDYSRLSLNGSKALAGADPNQNLQNPDSTWNSPFASRPPQPKPDLEQAAAMDRFKAMMEPPVVEKPAEVPGYSPAPTPIVDHNLQPMPVANRLGSSYTPVQNAAVRPTGINPLPTVTGQTAGQTAPKPKPLVKPPPWLSNKPQLGALPDRPF